MNWPLKFGLKRSPWNGIIGLQGYQERLTGLGARQQPSHDILQQRSTAMAKIRILLIEGNRLMREGIAAMFKGQSDLRVVAVAEDGNAVSQLKNIRKDPDVILWDHELERENGQRLMATLRERVPAARIIAMNISPEQLDIAEFVQAGVSGFILKNASSGEYLKTIRTVAAGARVLPPPLANSLFTQIVELALKAASGSPGNSIPLTNREREVIALISEGLSNKDIAERLHIATYTVKSHIHNILEKLGLDTRLQVAAFTHRERSG
jgi:two-component system nitrate/nitrite response regulator NarL